MKCHRQIKYTVNSQQSKPISLDLSGTKIALPIQQPPAAASAIDESKEPKKKKQKNDFKTDINRIIDSNRSFGGCVRERVSDVP